MFEDREGGAPSFSFLHNSEEEKEATLTEDHSPMGDTSAGAFSFLQDLPSQLEQERGGGGHDTGEGIGAEDSNVTLTQSTGQSTLPSLTETVTTSSTQPHPPSLSEPRPPSPVSSIVASESPLSTNVSTTNSAHFLSPAKERPLQHSAVTPGKKQTPSKGNKKIKRRAVRPGQTREGAGGSEGEIKPAEDVHSNWTSSQDNLSITSSQGTSENLVGTSVQDLVDTSVENLAEKSVGNLEGTPIENLVDISMDNVTEHGDGGVVKEEETRVCEVVKEENNSLLPVMDAISSTTEEDRTAGANQRQDTSDETSAGNTFLLSNSGQQDGGPPNEGVVTSVEGMPSDSVAPSGGVVSEEKGETLEGSPQLVLDTYSKVMTEMR